EFYGHSIPDKFTGRGECEIAYAVGVKLPCLLLPATRCLVSAGFRLSDNEHRFIERRACFAKPFLLFRRQHLVGVLQRSGRRYDMVSRNGNLYLVASEGQCELASSQELFVLPALVVIEHAHTREKLGDGIHIVFVLLEILQAAALSV